MTATGHVRSVDREAGRYVVTLDEQRVDFTLAWSPEDAEFVYPGAVCEAVFDDNALLSGGIFPDGAAPLFGVPTRAEFERERCGRTLLRAVRELRFVGEARV